MSPRACDCGKIPAITEWMVDARYFLQVKCECGHKGALLLYSNRGQRAKTLQAAVDGWNMRL